MTMTRLLLAALVLHLVLIQPNHPAALSWQALFLFPLEFPVILFALMALGQTAASRIVRMVLTAVLTGLVALKAADFVSFTALSRGFNPVTDLSLIDAFIRLLTGSVGVPVTLLIGVASLALILLIAWLIWWATGIWARLALPRIARLAAIPLTLLSAGVATAEIGQALNQWSLPATPPGAAFTARVGVERIEMIRETRARLAAFDLAASEDPFTNTTGLFEVIDRDVLVIFIESYGRTSFDTPFYADTHRATLESAEARLSDLGLSMQSGFLTSPTQGGQSWLAHTTFANGLWVDNQISHAAALASGRSTLYHHAAANGFRTATLMPQITLDWPEADMMGFEDVLVAADTGYAGLPFNWVTMPDQFTLATLDRLLRDGSDTRRLFAQVALVSSHAPWTPVPELLPWSDISDGTEFNEMAQAGDPPEVVWRDHDRVRAQYRLAVDYSLQVVFNYAALHAENPPLIIALGDHQAAGFIALDERAEVPIHVIGPEALVSRLTPLAPTLGLLPPSDAPAIGMEAARDIFLRAFQVEDVNELGN
ncbi:sulfatase [Gymnodinialimonas hymeniacidonis]|uniref:sulfatase n=1 Tax=Gymnodinialimonas hymeniacidonis TaxID=3126508 RepID=UPI0034C660F5